MDQESTTASRIGRWVGWLVVLALTAAVAVGTVAVVGQVTGQPLTRAAAAPSAAPTPTDPGVAIPAVAATGRALPASLIPVAGQPVGDAQQALQEHGATVMLSDGAGTRPVLPDWVVCGAGENMLADGSPTGQVTVVAVPAGESCS
jgi:hypothetical protein